MITVQHTQEALSRAHIIALAGHAGLNLSWPEQDYGVDCSVRGMTKWPDGRIIPSGPSIDLQLKATINWSYGPDARVGYDMEAKTWNDLVRRAPGVPPLYAVLLCLPRESREWLACSETQLVLQHCCYYYRPDEGEPETSNSRSRRVWIPRNNILDPRTLRGLVDACEVAAKGRAR